MICVGVNNEAYLKPLEKANKYKAEKKQKRRRRKYARITQHLFSGAR